MPVKPYYETDDGAVVLFHGDCRAVMGELPDGSVDAVVTDPPYGTKKIPWDESVDEGVIAECLRVSRGYSLFCYSNTRLYHILGIIKRLERDAWVICWHKPNAVGFERKFAPQWVPVVCAYSGKLPFFGKDYVKVPIKVHDFEHPTPKPVPLMQWLVQRAGKEAQTILDPFAGSGTTGIAAIQEGMKAILIEQDKGYCDIIVKRLKAEAAKTPLLSKPTRRKTADVA